MLAYILAYAYMYMYKDIYYVDTDISLDKDIQFLVKRHCVRVVSQVAEKLGNISKISKFG